MREGNWAKLPFAKTSGTVTGNRANKWAKGPVIICPLGGGGDKRGDQSKLRTQKGGSVETENPKGEITENFGRIQRGDHSNLVGK